MKRAHLHWFWRGAIATLVACGYGGLSVSVNERFHDSVMRSVQGLLPGPSTQPWKVAWSVPVAYFAPVVLLGFATYGVLTALWGRRPFDGETRCRKCGYILRGISEPRCSECGEPI